MIFTQNATKTCCIWRASCWAYSEADPLPAESDQINSAWLLKSRREQNSVGVQILGDWSFGTCEKEIWPSIPVKQSLKHRKTNEKCNLGFPIRLLESQFTPLCMRPWPGLQPSPLFFDTFLSFTCPEESWENWAYWNLHCSKCWLQTTERGRSGL